MCWAPSPCSAPGRAPQGEGVLSLAWARRLGRLGGCPGFQWVIPCGAVPWVMLGPGAQVWIHSIHKDSCPLPLSQD